MVYHYCERLGPGFWAEPVNALSNVAFLIAEAMLIRHIRRINLSLRQIPDIVAMLVLLCAIAVGSFLWHTLARPWAQWADVVPILLYISLYLLSFLVRVARLSLPKVIAWFLLYHALNIGALWLIPPQTWNGSMFYLPTLVTLLLLGIYCQRQDYPYANRLLVAGLVFVVSLLCRTLDFALCPIWPMGTHFLWHLLDAYVLYAITRILLPDNPMSVKHV